MMSGCREGGSLELLLKVALMVGPNVFTRMLDSFRVNLKDHAAMIDKGRDYLFLSLLHDIFH